jgi:hypothetical protein
MGGELSGSIPISALARRQANARWRTIASPQAAAWRWQWQQCGIPFVRADAAQRSGGGGLGLVVHPESGVGLACDGRQQDRLSFEYFDAAISRLPSALMTTLASPFDGIVSDSC